MQHARAAVAQTIQFEIHNKIDFIFCQEPYTREGVSAGFPLQWTVFQKSDHDHSPRAIIVSCNPDWSPTIISLDQDNVAILLEVHSLSIILASNYSPPTAEIGPTTRFIQRILHQFRIPDMIFAGDFNSHNTAWGYHTTDPKGRELEDFLSSSNLIVQNTAEAPPSFDRVFAQGWPDLTLTTLHAAPLLQDWKVEEDESLSDHKFITFSLSETTRVSKIRRYNLPGRKIKTFSRKIKTQLTRLEPSLQQAHTAAELEDFSLKLQETMQAVCNQNLPLKKP
ncbi:uncharacterized protein LOC118197469 [Stegodyphus dumicola]|uniref:uncharacterized protein LOC118197469 n=1 Tax=Stegodyphus dumicola TaxID=202533 RepID=UPI0015AE6F13|nr:uncharacterized protein LOC118197469 [Stegodyphus dumicola]